MSLLLRCEREDDFMRMVNADAETQARIRDENPEAAHCRFLQQKHDACHCYPETVTDAKGELLVASGNPCPNNPFEQERVKKLIDALMEKQGLLATCEMYGDMALLNTLPSIWELTPEEFAAAKIIHTFTRSRELRLLAGAHSMPV